MPITHRHLINLMTSLKLGDPDGICAGISEMGVSEFLSGHFERFCKRLDSLEKVNSDELSKANETLFDELLHEDKYNSLKPDERKTLDDKRKELAKKFSNTLAFFEGVELYLSSNNHSDLFNKYTSPYDTPVIAKLIQTNEFKNKEERIEIASLSGIYNCDELKSWISSLNDAIKMNPPPVNFALSLGSGRHRISLCYSGIEDQWTFIDANNLWIIQVKLDYFELPHLIFSAFFDRENTGFITKVVTTRAQQEQVEKIVESWTKKIEHIQKITEDNANRTSDHNDNLAYFASKMNDPKTVRLLVEKKFDFNKTNSNGSTSAHVAAQEGYIEVIRVLAEKKVNLDLTNKHSASPVYLAAENGHAEMIRFLVKEKADLNRGTDRGVTPAFIAAQQGFAEVIRVLAENKADLNKATHRGRTPADIASCCGHFPVLYTLVEFGVDLRKQSMFLKKHHLFPDNFIKEVHDSLNKLLPDRMNVVKQLNTLIVEYKEKKQDQYHQCKAELDKLDNFTRSLFAMKQELNSFIPDGFNEIDKMLQQKYKKFSNALTVYPVSFENYQDSLLVEINKLKDDIRKSIEIKLPIGYMYRFKTVVESRRDNQRKFIDLLDKVSPDFFSGNKSIVPCNVKQ